MFYVLEALEIIDTIISMMRAGGMTDILAQRMIDNCDRSTENDLGGELIPLGSACNMWHVSLWGSLLFDPRAYPRR